MFFPPSFCQVNHKKNSTRCDKCGSIKASEIRFDEKWKTTHQSPKAKVTPFVEHYGSRKQLEGSKLVSFYTGAWSAWIRVGVVESTAVLFLLTPLGPNGTERRYKETLRKTIIAFNINQTTVLNKCKFASKLNGFKTAAVKLLCSVWLQQTLQKTPNERNLVRRCYFVLRCLYIVETAVILFQRHREAPKWFP